MDSLQLDAMIFPAVADADVNPVSADIGWSNGIWVVAGAIQLSRCLSVRIRTVLGRLMPYRLASTFQLDRVSLA
ncbi:hypothetical protein BVH06_15545 [Pseudomonas sp. PA27(2017)]|nr:hypothetical protein BVH06_15545 [Pseudomonas sp. PA27(2017)]